MQLWLYLYQILTHWGGDKMTPLCKRYFHIHFFHYLNSRWCGLLTYIYAHLASMISIESKSSPVIVSHYLIITGMATTSTALYCLVGLMAMRPEIQKRMQDEIGEVMGDRAPSMADRTKTPYTEAVLLELLRYLSHLPLALPHKATKDTTLMGYRVPSGTTVRCLTHWPL